ncbi:hypothetical protein HOV23_gp062 [Pseudomonas phage Lana]|uniref:Uncharacterized protein n=1 Tax=Pseudomonas phage Lana TaxID=2530172 RepID=A0A481W5Y9_9CAUD|nr:hypothetical protein HOV23_gp062 [Pseudomonas phage Lana]QBJ04511.1 hypothetical protein [Pseudomonas phage Lana]
MHLLSDKNIQALVLQAADCQPIGAGDVIMLCTELQSRREADKNGVSGVLADRLIQRLSNGDELVPEQVDALRKYLPVEGREQQLPNVVLMDQLIERIEKKEEMLDRQVLALFNGLKKHGYFQTICVVDKHALHNVLSALGNVGQSHLIREMIATRGLPTAQGGVQNPIDQLAADFKAGLTDADFNAN